MISHHPEVERHVTPLSGEFAVAWARGRTDIVFWAWYFLGIRLHISQRLFARACTQISEDGWHVRWRDIVVSAGNQAGKTLALAVILLHHAFYKFGMVVPSDDPRSLEAWRSTPYDWFHIAYRQALTRHVYREIDRIARGVHAAQMDRVTNMSRGCPIMQRFPGCIVTDEIEEKLYESVRIADAFGGARIHFRNTDEKGKSILGNPANGLSFDEAASEPYLFDIIDNVLHARRTTTGGPIYYISTPDFHTFDFPDLWEMGNPANEQKLSKRLSLRLSTRDNIGYGITQEDFDDLIANKDADWIAQHIDGLFIEAKDAYFLASEVRRVFSDADLEAPLPEEERPTKGHKYVQGGDVGIKKDPSPIVTLDFTGSMILGARIRETPSPTTTPALVNQLIEGALLFGMGEGACMTIIDSTAMGGQMFLQETRGAIARVREFNFAGKQTKKLDLLSDVKFLMEKNRLRLPHEGRLWLKLRRQMLGYRLGDEHIEQDMVMALAMAVYHAIRNSYVGPVSKEFRFFGGKPNAEPVRRPWLGRG